MSCDALTVIGGTTEFIGVAFVVLDIRATRRHAREIVRRDLGFHAKATGTLTASGEVESSDAEQPTLEQRITRLEERVTNQQRGHERELRELRDSLESRIAEGVAAAAADTDERDRVLRTAIRDMLEGGMVGRVVGAVLVLLGIVLSVLGAVLTC